MANFGVSIGDFVTLGTLAWNLYRFCKTASAEFEEVAREVISLHTAIKELEDDAGTTTIAAQGGEYLQKARVRPVGEEHQERPSAARQASDEVSKSVYQASQEMGHIQVRPRRADGDPKQDCFPYKRYQPLPHQLVDRESE